MIFNEGQSNEETIDVPLVADILTKFSQEYMPRKFTIEFINKAYQQFVPIPFLMATNEAVDKSVDFYNAVTQRSGPIDNRAVRATIDHYFKFRTSISWLENSLPSIEDRYVKEIQKVTFLKKGKTQREFISESLAKNFLNDPKDGAKFFIQRDIEAQLSITLKLKTTDKGETNLTEIGVQSKGLLQNPKIKAFLITIRYAESYGRVAAGGLPLQYNEAFNFKKFESFSDHPGTLKGNSSSAAGAYQIMKDTWYGKGKDIGAKKILGLSDFSPISQDIFAVYKLQQKDAVSYILSDDFSGAIHAASTEWASLPDRNKGDQEKNPTSRYTGQKAIRLSWLKDIYDMALKGQL